MRGASCLPTTCFRPMRSIVRGRGWRHSPPTNRPVPGRSGGVYVRDYPGAPSLGCHASRAARGPPGGSRDRRGSTPTTTWSAAGADLAPGTLLEAYRRGLFPMPSGRRGDPMLWFSPVRRGVLPPGRAAGLAVAAPLVRQVRDPRRHGRSPRSSTPAPTPGGPPAGSTRRSGRRTSSCTASAGRTRWRPGATGGWPAGCTASSIGGLFAGESMFHRETDASKVALVGLVELLRDAHRRSHACSTCSGRRRTSRPWGWCRCRAASTSGCSRKPWPPAFPGRSPEPGLGLTPPGIACRLAPSGRLDP